MDAPALVTPKMSLLSENVAYWTGFEDARSCVFLGDCANSISGHRMGLSVMVGAESEHVDLDESVFPRVGQDR